MDFRSEVLLADQLGRMEKEDPVEWNSAHGGIDHCFAVDGAGPGRVVRAAKVRHEGSGRWMEFWTNMPGAVFYTANWTPEGLGGKDGATYGKHCGFCVECQFAPDAVNNEELMNKGSVLFRPGEEFENVTRVKFGAE
jgi:aldose 1-epimerase